MRHRACVRGQSRNPLGTISNALQVLRLRSEAEDETWRRAIDTAERRSWLVRPNLSSEGNAADAR